MTYSAQVIWKKLCIKKNFDYLASTCETSEKCIYYLFLLHFLFVLEYVFKYTMENQLSNTEYLLE